MPAFVALKWHATRLWGNNNWSAIELIVGLDRVPDRCFSAEVTMQPYWAFLVGAEWSHSSTSHADPVDVRRACAWSTPLPVLARDLEKHVWMVNLDELLAEGLAFCPGLLNATPKSVVET